MLVRLIYASSATVSVTTETVRQIMDVARTRNELRNITGMLVFDHQNFLQVIEGRRDVVNQLLASLMRDARHTNIELLAYGEIEQRQFERWSMGFAATVSSNRAMLLRHGVSARFEPHTLSEAGAVALLGELTSADVAG